MTKDKTVKTSIDQAYQELQTIVEEFEQDEVDLEKSLPKFKRGLELAAELKQRLGVLKNEVEEIKASFEDAAPPPVDDAAEDDEDDPNQIPF